MLRVAVFVAGLAVGSCQHYTLLCQKLPRSCYHHVHYAGGSALRCAQLSDEVYQVKHRGGKKDLLLDATAVSMPVLHPTLSGGEV